MATSEFAVSITNVKDYKPDVEEYGLLDSNNDFDAALQNAENDVIRQVREEWWERYRHTVRYKDITKVTSIELDSTKSTNSQWTRAVVYKALAEYILPLFTKWVTPEGDKDAFQVQMEFYRAKYAQEFQAVLRDGVEYDEDADGTVTTSEKEPIHHLKLIR